VLDRVSKVGADLAGIAIVVMMIVMVLEAAGRYLFSFTVLFADELLGYLMALVTYVGLAYTLRTGGHISIELVTDHLPKKVQRILGVVVSVLNLVFVGFLVWASWVYWLNIFNNGFGTPGVIPVPLAVPTAVLPLGVTVFLAGDISETWQRIKNFKSSAAMKDYENSAAMKDRNESAA